MKRVWIGVAVLGCGMAAAVAGCTMTQEAGQAIAPKVSAVAPEPEPAQEPTVPDYTAGINGVEKTPYQQETDAIRVVLEARKQQRVQNTFNGHGLLPEGEHRVLGDLPAGDAVPLADLPQGEFGMAPVGQAQYVVTSGR